RHGGGGTRAGGAGPRAGGGAGGVRVRRRARTASRQARDARAGARLQPDRRPGGAQAAVRTDQGPGQRPGDRAQAGALSRFARERYPRARRGTRRGLTAGGHPGTRMRLPQRCRKPRTAPGCAGAPSSHKRTRGRTKGVGAKREARMSKADFLFTSESVAEGHPDKICDRSSDSILDAYLAADPNARVAAETLSTTNRIVIAGEVRGPDSITPAHIEQIARDVVREIGYEQEGFHWAKAKVDVLLHAQSPDIALGVDAAGNKDEGA